MHDSIAIPVCFSSNEKQTDHDPVIRSGQRVFMSVYRTEMAGRSHQITITWCRNLLLHGLSVSVQHIDRHQEQTYQCKVQLKPWYFWRKQGCKNFIVDGKTVDVVWDLKTAKFNGETEPRSNFYVAIVCEAEVVLLLGDLKKDAYRRTGCRPSLTEPILVSRREHVFGKKRFPTRIRFDHDEKGGVFHDVLIELHSSNNSNSNSDHGLDTELQIRIDRKPVVDVKHLQWKFRGHNCVNVCKKKIEIYWDVHDWLFGSGPRNGLFIFKPVLSPPTSSSSESDPLSSNEKVCYAYASKKPDDDDVEEGSSSFCFLLYAWKIE